MKDVEHGVLTDTVDYNTCRGKNAVAVFYARASL
jgi:hypothetical protein